jgi:outer membrane protein OmpA-like peptidoglycan-associated protein
MSPGKQPDWSGLLYVPGEELVRSTIDGDDADWSESLSYVPSDTLVRAVLHAPNRERPTFVLPETLMPSAPRVSHRARWAAALLAGLGFSPFSMAAAAVIHLAFLLAIGPWILTQANAVRSIRMPRPPAIAATRLVYYLPSRGNSVPITRLRKQPRTISQPVDTTNSGIAAVTTRKPDSAGSLPARPSQGNVEREVINALNQELVFARDGFELEQDDRPKLELIVRVLTRWPELRLRVLGAAPRPREGGSLPGMAEAEAIKRALVQAGISPERIEVGQMPEAERRCAEREPNCAAVRRRVRTMSVGFVGERGVNRPPD